MHLQYRLELMALIVVFAVVPHVALADVAGTYSCSGTNPNGTPYSGKTVISKNGGGYTLKWTIGGATHTGTALLMDGQLSASWGVPGGAYGIVVYKVKDNGQLVGRWMNPSGGALGTETLSPR